MDLVDKVESAEVVQETNDRDTIMLTGIRLVHQEGDDGGEVRGRDCFFYSLIKLKRKIIHLKIVII